MKKSDLEILDQVLTLVRSKGYVVQKIELPVSGDYSSQALKLDLTHAPVVEDLSYLDDAKEPKRIASETLGVRSRKILGI